MRFDSRMLGDDDAEISTHLIFSVKKPRTDSIDFMLRLGLQLHNGLKSEKTALFSNGMALKRPSV